jgi:DNA-binding CsgD family transcriptional regulator
MLPRTTLIWQHDSQPSACGRPAQFIARGLTEPQRRLCNRLLLNIGATEASSMTDENFSKLVDRIYDTVVAPEEHNRVLGEVLSATGSHFMIVTGFRPGELAPIAPNFIGELSSRRLDGIADYEAGAFAGDLTVAFVNAHPNSGVFATDVNMTEAAHATNPYIKWNRHYVGNAHWLAHFEAKDGAIFGASLHSRSPDEPHASADRQQFELLFQHMARAWRLATRPADLTSHNEALALVNCAGRVLAMSPAAHQLTDAGDGLVIRWGELLPSECRMWSRWREATRKVALSRAADDKAFLLPRASEARPLAVTIGAAPLQPGFASYSRDVLVRIIDRDARPLDVAAKLMRLWGLTPAEGRLVQTLMGNDVDLRDAANQLGVSYATVRTQLACVFAKTETSGQPELMRLVTRLSG